MAEKKMASVLVTTRVYKIMIILYISLPPRELIKFSWLWGRQSLNYIYFHLFYIKALFYLKEDSPGTTEGHPSYRRWKLSHDLSLGDIKWRLNTGSLLLKSKGHNQFNMYFVLHFIIPQTEYTLLVFIFKYGNHNLSRTICIQI